MKVDMSAALLLATAWSLSVGVIEATLPSQEVKLTNEYDCFLCVVSVEHALEKSLPTMRQGCESLFGGGVCDDYDVTKKDFEVQLGLAPSLENARSVCLEKTAPGTCSDVTKEFWRQSRNSSVVKNDGSAETVMDVRVAKGYGARVSLC